jgi:predicted protein tyrosine phosphatase
MSKIVVFSRLELESSPPQDVPHVVVSISCPGDRKTLVSVNEHTLKVLHLAFHDLGDEAMAHVDIRDQYEAACFSPADARKILALVKTYPEAQRIVVQCDAGLSRSPGVAAALSKILEGDDSYFFKRYMPNSRVYRTLLEEHHAPGD